MKKNIPIHFTEDEKVKQIAKELWQRSNKPQQEHQTYTIPKQDEEKVSQEPEYDKGVTMPRFYALIITAVCVILYLSYTKYEVNEKRIEANRQIQILQNSSWAQIDRLLQEKKKNQKWWETEQKLKEQAQKQIDSSTIKQAEYNASTYRIDEEIKKFGISITQ